MIAFATLIVAAAFSVSFSFAYWDENAGLQVDFSGQTGLFYVDYPDVITSSNVNGVLDEKKFYVKVSTPNTGTYSYYEMTAAGQVGGEDARVQEKATLSLEQGQKCEIYFGKDKLYCNTYDGKIDDGSYSHGDFIAKKQGKYDLYYKLGNNYNALVEENFTLKFTDGDVKVRFRTFGESERDVTYLYIWEENGTATKELLGEFPGSNLNKLVAVTAGTTQIDASFADNANLKFIISKYEEKNSTTQTGTITFNTVFALGENYKVITSGMKGISPRIDNRLEGIGDALYASVCADSAHTPTTAFVPTSSDGAVLYPETVVRNVSAAGSTVYRNYVCVSRTGKQESSTAYVNFAISPAAGSTAAKIKRFEVKRSPAGADGVPTDGAAVPMSVYNNPAVNGKTLGDLAAGAGAEKTNPAKFGNCPYVVLGFGQSADMYYAMDVEIETDVAASFALTAWASNFDKKAYDVKLDVATNNGSWSDSASDNAIKTATTTAGTGKLAFDAAGNIVGIPVPKSADSQMVFRGWYTVSDPALGDETKKVTAETVFAKNGDTIYAVFKDAPKKVIFKADGATPATQTLLTDDYGYLVSKSDYNVPTMRDKFFAGWELQSGDVKKIYKTIDEIVKTDTTAGVLFTAAETTLTAVWNVLDGDWYIRGTFSSWLDNDDYKLDVSTGRLAKEIVISDLGLEAEPARFKVKKLGKDNEGWHGYNYLKQEAQNSDYLKAWSDKENEGDKDIRFTKIGVYTIECYYVSGSFTIDVQRNVNKHDITNKKGTGDDVHIDIVDSADNAMSSCGYGDAVKVKVTTETDHRLSKLYYVKTGEENTEANRKPIDMTTLEFVMPNYAIDVYAEFVRLYGVTSITDANDNTVTPQTNKVAAGEPYTLTVAPANGYELTELKYGVGENDKIDLSKGTSVAGGTEYTFTMPYGGATVTAKFGLKKYNIRVVKNIDAAGEVQIKNAAGAADINQITKDDTFTYTVSANSGYRITGLKIFNKSVEIGAEEKTSKTGKFEFAADDTYADVEIDVTFAQEFDVTTAVSPAGATDITVNGSGKYVAGEKVTISVTVAEGSQYEFSSFEFGGTTVTNKTENGTAVTFTMPDGNVTVTAKVVEKAQKLRIILDTKDWTNDTNGTYSYHIHAWKADGTAVTGEGAQDNRWATRNELQPLPNSAGKYFIDLNVADITNIIFTHDKKGTREEYTRYEVKSQTLTLGKEEMYTPTLNDINRDSTEKYTKIMLKYGNQIGLLFVKNVGSIHYWGATSDISSQSEIDAFAGTTITSTDSTEIMMIFKVYKGNDFTNKTGDLTVKYSAGEMTYKEIKPSDNSPTYYCFMFNLAIQ